MISTVSRESAPRSTNLDSAATCRSREKEAAEGGKVRLGLGCQNVKHGSAQKCGGWHEFWEGAPVGRRAPHSLKRRPWESAKMH